MSLYSNYEARNNVKSELYAPISSLATTVQVASGEGERWGTTFPMLATLENIDSDGKVLKREIVEITARSEDTLTIIRKFAPCLASDDANTQGATSFSFDAGDSISNYIAKEYLDKIKDGFDNVGDTFDDVYLNGTDELRTYKTTGLGVEVKAGKVLVGSSYYDFEGGTLTLTDNATNYIEIDEDGFLVSNTTGWTLENAKISKVITSSGEVSSIEDWRLGTVGGKIGGTDIHELTEKDKVNSKDEIIIADSENIRQSKKVKIGNIIAVGDGQAIERIETGNMVYSESCVYSSGTYTSFGFSSDVQKISVKRISNGSSFSTINLKVGKRGTPTSFSVRIESDNNGVPSGMLINENAYGTVNGGNVSTSSTDIVVNMADTVTIERGTICHIVLSADTVSSSNFFFVFGNGHSSPNIFKIKQYNGSTRNDFVDHNPVFQFEDMYTIASKTLYRTSYGFDIKRYGGKDYLMTPCYNYTSCFMASKNASNNVSSYVESSAIRTTGYAARGGAMNSNGKSIMYFAQNQFISSTLSTARDLSTFQGGSSYAKSISPSSITNFPYSAMDCARVSPDGKTVYFGQSNQPIIHVLHFSTAYNVSTYQTYSSSTDRIFLTFSGVSGKVATLDFSPDGKMLIRHNGSTGYRAKMSTARNTSTLQFGGSFSIPSNSRGMTFTPDGHIIIDNGSNATYTEYGSRRIYGDNIIIYMKCNGLADTETCKASASMVFGNSGYIPGSAIDGFDVGEVVKYNISVNDNLQGLIPNTKYYLSNNGNVHTSGSQEVGIAIDPTILKLKQTY